jgi:hypothetical protein
LSFAQIKIQFPLKKIKIYQKLVGILKKEIVTPESCRNISKSRFIFPEYQIRFPGKKAEILQKPIKISEIPFKILKFGGF